MSIQDKTIAQVLVTALLTVTIIIGAWFIISTIAEKLGWMWLLFPFGLVGMIGAGAFNLKSRDE